MGLRNPHIHNIFPSLHEVQALFAFRIQPVAKQIPQQTAATQANLKSCDALIENYTLSFLAAISCPRKILNTGLSTQFADS